MDEFPLIIWPVAKIAERDGVSRPAVSKQVKKILATQPDTPIEMDVRGRITGISIAHYDEHRERFLNPAKAAGANRTQAARSPASTPPAADSFEEARRQSEWIKVRREQIRHQEEIGQLVRKDRLVEAAAAAGNEARTVIGRLPNYADELALAISKEGVHGARTMLRKISVELGNQLADRFEAVAGDAPGFDALIEDIRQSEGVGDAHE